MKVEKEGRKNFRVLIFLTESLRTQLCVKSSDVCEPCVSKFKLLWMHYSFFISSFFRWLKRLFHFFRKKYKSASELTFTPNTFVVTPKHSDLYSSNRCVYVYAVDKLFVDMDGLQIMCLIRTAEMKPFMSSLQRRSFMPLLRVSMVCFLCFCFCF